MQMVEDPKIYIGLRLKGRYLIEEHIGSGLSAHAFKAYDTLLQGRVVVKIIKTTIAGIPVNLGDQWKAESHKAMQVRGHPHIASILDLGEEDFNIGDETNSLHYIVTEFIQGKTLRDLSAERVPLETKGLFSIAHQILSTLDFLQARKLSHDDLHAGNIMISHIDANKPFIKIIDFGMASNVLMPKARENDIHSVLNQLVYLCRNTLAVSDNQKSRVLLEGFAAILKKAQNFISAKRMRIVDLIAEIEVFQQRLSSLSLTSVAITSFDDGPRKRISIDRRTPCIGREDELNRLKGIISNAFLSKRGTLVFLSGEAGVGKTRLVDEALGLVSADQTRHLFLYSTCRETMSLPYAPVMDAVIDFLDEIPGENIDQKMKVVLGSDTQLAGTVVKLINEYKAMLDGVSPGNTAGSDSSNTVYILTSFLTKAALNTPIVIFFDDIHWADRQTVDLIGFLAHRVKDTPIVVINTYRPEEIGRSDNNSPKPLADLLRTIDNLKTTRTIELNDLEREDVDEILANIYAFSRPQDFVKLSDSIREMAGGNPFFLFEITALLEDEGILRERNENQWIIAGNLDEFSVPYSINSLIQRRADRLSLNEILLLRAAAIQGDTFDVPILERMFIPPDSSIQEIINNIVDCHGLIQCVEPGRRYTFSQHQLCLAFIRSMDQEDLARGHGEVAKLMMEFADHLGTPVPHHKIANHLALAGERIKAAEYYQAAGNKALKAEQFHLALDNLVNAVNLLDPPELETDVGIQVTLDLIEAVKPLGERVIHEQALHQLQAIAGHTGKEDLELKALLEECTYLRMISENERSLKIARELIHKAGEAGNEDIEAAALKEAGTCCYLTGELKEAESMFHHSAGILASIGDRPNLARIYNNLGLVCRSTNRQDEMIQFFNRALEIFRDTGDLIGQRFPLGNLGIVYFEQGDYERAFDCFRALKVSFGSRTDLMMEAKVDFTLGEIYLEIGLLDKAVESCESALSTYITIGNRQGESDVLAMLGSVHLAMDNIQIAREYFERSIEVRKAVGNKIGILQSQITLARIANLEGRHAEALKLTQEIMKDVHVRKNRSLELECLTEVLVARSQIDSAEEALHILGPDEEPAELKIDSRTLIPFAFKVGELAFQAGDENKALKYIALSGKMVEQILENITEPEWREAYKKKRSRIIETYHRLKPAITASNSPVHDGNSQMKISPSSTGQDTT